MCFSDAVTIVIFALPDLSSGWSLRARLLARIVPPMPPPTIRIFIAPPSLACLDTRMDGSDPYANPALWIAMRSFRLLDLDVPHAGLLARSDELVADLPDP